MKSLIIFCLSVAIAASGCKSHGLSGVIATKGIVLQAEQLKNSEDAPDILYLKIKILVDASQSNSSTADLNNTMWYKTDSCFYLIKNNVRISASLLQPVAGGVSGVYEYLAEFESGQQQPTDHLSLAFYDKNISRKEYLIKLKD